jgi:RND family efflux transporter MFP subunit
MNHLDRFRSAAFLLALAAFAAGCGGHEAGHGGASSGPAVTVSVVRAGAAGDGALVLPARVSAREEVTLTARIAAQLTALPLREGDRFRGGDVLARFDAPETRASLDGARAGLEAATVARDLARRQEERMDSLYAARVAALRELEGAQAERRGAEAQWAQAKAQLDGLESAVQLAAPFDGVVVRRHADPGATLGPGQPVLDIRSSAVGEVTAMVPESELGRLAGARPEYQVGDGPWLPARLARVDGMTDFATRSRTARLRPVGGERLEPGAFARVRFAGGASAGGGQVPALSVPATALVRRGALTGVFVAADGHARLRWLRVGHESGGAVEVLSGLGAEDRVILDPRGLADGRAVRLVTPSFRTVGLAGRLAGLFLHSRLTPLTVLASILLGLLATATLPREEEPQIKVPMVDVQLAWPGTPVEQVERQLTTPVERQLWQIPDLEYLYSISRDDGAALILRFRVGFDPDQALTRVRTRLDEAQAAMPAGSKVWSVSPRAIDDVPVLALTLSTADSTMDQSDLRRVASELAMELRKTDGVARVRVLGGEPRTVRVAPDPARMGAAGVTLDALARTVEGAGLSLPAGDVVSGDRRRELRAESPLAGAAELGALLVPAAGGRAVRLSEVADVTDGAGEITNYVFLGSHDHGTRPAVTVEVAKRPGVNATAMVHELHRRVAELRPVLLGGVDVTTTRDYGETAKHKSDDLMFHLLLATLSVIVLIALALGRREAVVVAIAIPVTLALTLFLYRFLGYTLNRVTLFALIFSIGILVDDAIVVVENITRHFAMKDGRDTDVRVVEAVDEVGNPTVLATVAVIAAILPLAYVGGLMGPYMKPIPIGASLAMLFSLAVAFMVSPWAARRVLRPQDAHAHEPKEGRLDRAYRRWMARLIDDGRARWWFFGGLAALLVAVMGLFAVRAVTVKMLPFDNKSEFEVLLDMPPGTPLERTLATAEELAREVAKLPEAENWVVYGGLGSPVTFNGLVRHYDFRADPRFASVQVNLVEAKHRKRQSHAIARDVRPALAAIAARAGGRVKVVEVPPGPPVLSTLVAEVYGPDLEGQREFARRVHAVFDSTAGVVDTELMLTEGQPRTRLVVDRDRTALAGVAAAQAAAAAMTLYRGQSVGTLRAPDEPEAVPIQVRLAEADRADLAALGALRMGAGRGTPLSEFVRARHDTAPPEIMHKNLRRVVYVLGDVAGREEAPVYAIAALRPKVDALTAPDGGKAHQLSTKLPDSDERYSLKWDGEWHITYEVFRDMGAAFAVVLVLIYVLTVGWFRSFTTPLIIMLPIPLSLVGILPAHAMVGAFFTATSMIGFIAGAGIQVRNSIILVDFIELRLAQGLSLQEACIDAGVIRFRPMVLTAAAVIVGGAVILFDPIFQGLAVALIGGAFAAPVLSRASVPLLYYLLKRGGVQEAAARPQALPAEGAGLEPAEAGAS